MLLLRDLNHRVATAIRLFGLAVICWTVLTSRHTPATSGRGLVVTVTLVLAVASWLVWTMRPNGGGTLTPELFVLAAAGGALTGACPDSAASAFVFVAVTAAGVRVELVRALAVVALGALALAVAILVYNGSGLGLLAYSLGFVAMLLAASNSRQSAVRAEQAELLLAQAQRSYEEQLRAARLEESTRIAREIHDLLAHALAGLTIQLEATRSLLEQGADRETVLARVQRAHELAREGLRETRRAVGALRGEPQAAPADIEALVADYRASADAPARLSIEGDPARLSGQTGQAVLRAVQEALTNARKHAPGAGVTVAIQAGEGPTDDIVLVVEDRPPAVVVPAVAQQPPQDREPPSATSGGYGPPLAATGGGYGLQGMRERAALLGGTLSAGTDGDGWRVELRLPPPAAGSERGSE